MKKLLALLTLILVVKFSNSQTRVGFMGGMNRATVLETNDLPNWGTAIKPNYKPLYGPEGGLFAEVALNKKGFLFFQPGVFYSSQGRKYSQQFDTTVYTTIDSSSTLHLNYFHIPFNLVLKFKIASRVKFMIGAGPYAAFFFNGSEKTDANYTNSPHVSTSNTDLPVGNAKGKYKTLDYGAHVMAGFEIGHFFIRGDASQSLSDFYQSPNYNGSFKHQVISGSIGFTIDLKSEPLKKKEPKKEKPKTETPKKEKTVKTKDKDNDGVPDKVDECPDQAGTAATKGCPDKDGDGVADKDDRCPDEAGSAANHGCPVIVTPPATEDTDGDGVLDKDDQCPSIKGLLRYHGCPIPDTDGDGVNDEIDHCKTEPGPATNHGCPVKPKNQVKDEITDEMTKTVEESAGKVMFEQSKWDLSADSRKALDAVAEILKNKSGLRLQIDGYASEEGDHYTNLGVSNARANAVKDYLVAKGIDEKRLKVAYYGADKPVTTDPGQQHQNRRVEMKLY